MGHMFRDRAFNQDISDGTPLMLQIRDSCFILLWNSINPRGLGYKAVTTMGNV